MGQRMRVKRTVPLFFLLFFFYTLFAVDSACSAGFDTSRDSWAVISGYGQSFPGWGETTQRVHTVDLIPRYEYHIFDNIGSGWFRGFHSLLLEIPFSFILSPDVSVMVGINFLACYTFTASEKWHPYLFGGGGPLYSFADIKGMGAEFNGNYQFGLGVKHHWKDNHNLLFELRYHHISNGGNQEPNEPLNSCKILFGITF